MKPHSFEPGVVQLRRIGQDYVKLARCRVCSKPGREYVRTNKTGRVSRYWQHQSRPDIEPIVTPAEACDWQGAGRIWCCREQGHAGSHHAHRGPRRSDVR